MTNEQTQNIEWREEILLIKLKKQPEKYLKIKKSQPMTTTNVKKGDTTVQRD